MSGLQGKVPRSPQDFIPARLTCPHCGNVHLRPASWAYADYCCRACYLAAPLPLMPWIKAEDVARAYRMSGLTIGAASLGVSRQAMGRVTVKLGLRVKSTHGGNHARTVSHP